MKKKIGVIINEAARPSSYTDPNTGQQYTYGENDGLMPIDPINDIPEQKFYQDNYTTPVMETTTTQPQYGPPVLVPQLQGQVVEEKPAPKKNNLPLIIGGLALLYFLTRNK